MDIKYLIPAFILILASWQNSMAQNPGSAKVFNISDFGAVGDGVVNNTAAIQKAIDEAGKNGGGMVVVSAGKFLTGPIQLRAGVELRLQEAAILLGSPRRLDYGTGNAVPLISGVGLNNISITGKGTIDGNAHKLIKDIFDLLQAGSLQDPEWQTENPWHQKRPTEGNRPQLIHLYHCDNIKILGITIKNASTWVQDYKECNGLVIDGISVESTSYWNNDGIDVVDCKDVKITNCRVNADDDGICLKSENPGKLCEDILIKNCRVRSSASAIKFGTASIGGFKNIKVEDIEVYDTYRSAIALEAVDGGILDSILVQNIKAYHTGNAIFIKLGHRNKTDLFSRVHHVIIRDLEAYVPSGKPDKGYEMEGPEIKYPHNVFPASITGLPDHLVSDILLEHIQIEYEGGADKNIASVALDSIEHITENAAGYPEFSMFGELPVSGIYIRHAERITLKNVELKYKKPDFRVPCIFDDVDKLDISGLKVKGNQSTAIILINKVKNQHFINMNLPVGANGIMKIQ